MSNNRTRRETYLATDQHPISAGAFVALGSLISLLAGAIVLLLPMVAR